MYYIVRLPQPLIVITCYSFLTTLVPFAVVELPDEPDGKKYDVYFEREGQIEASTQTVPLHVTVKLMASFSSHVSLLNSNNVYY